MRQNPKHVVLEIKQTGQELLSLKLGNCVLPVSSANFLLFPRLSQAEQWLGIHVRLGVSFSQEGKCKLEAPNLQLSGAPQLILDLAAIFSQGFLIPELRAWSHKMGRCPPAARRVVLPSCCPEWCTPGITFSRVFPSEWFLLAPSLESYQ